GFYDGFYVEDEAHDPFEDAGSSPEPTELSVGLDDGIDSTVDGMPDAEDAPLPAVPLLIEGEAEASPPADAPTPADTPMYTDSPLPDDAPLPAETEASDTTPDATVPDAEPEAADEGSQEPPAAQDPPMLGFAPIAT